MHFTGKPSRWLVLCMVQTIRSLRFYRQTELEVGVLYEVQAAEVAETFGHCRKILSAQGF